MIYLGADHGGFELKEHIKQWLAEWNMEYQDLGANTLDPDDDYPDFAFAVAEAVAQQPNKHKGVLACRSAAGVVVAANKVTNIRAVSVHTTEGAQHSREHNDANVIGLSGDWMTFEQAKEVLYTWLMTEFSTEERHQRRLDKIINYEHRHGK